MQNKIYPGRIWLDTDGNPIQAHGGAIYYENNIYYWYGENKDHTDGKCEVWTWGIKYYSSSDLCNWKYEGFLIEPDTDNRNSLLHPSHRMDRPHIIKSPATGKYVCWLKFSGEDACFAVLTSEQFSGPYTMVREHFRPFGKKVGDFDIAVGQDGCAYLLFDSDHAGLTGAWLTRDYTDVTGEPAWHCAGLYPPYCREGPSYFEHNGKHYVITSGMTGYLPNPSRTDVADAVDGPYTTQGNPHVEDESSASFNSQISQIFKVPGKKDMYIALADRWVPEYKMTRCIYEALERAIGARFDPDKYKPSAEDIKLMMESPMLASADTSISRYVWLPVRFEGDVPKIDWHEEWSPVDT